MIDTIKIYTEISCEVYQKIYSKSIVKSSINKSTGQILYEVVNDHLEGSYSSSLSVRVGCGVKYSFCNLDGGYYIEIEGSYHKIVKGFNSHNGFYDLQFICKELISFVENAYTLNLPSLNNWFLQRCDIAICYDLKTQENVKTYINNLSKCEFPRRKSKFYTDESIYFSGTTSTLKIYNKFLEFKKHDLKKFVNTDFDLLNYFNIVQGYVRFECEIKKKYLVNLYNSKHIKVVDVIYDDLKKVWSDEFMKVLKLVDSDLKIVRGREEVKNRLFKIFKKSKAIRLYNFYCAIQLNGFYDVKHSTSSSVFYRDIKDLKSARVDFSQTYNITEDNNLLWFNPFEYEEVV